MLSTESLHENRNRSDFFGKYKDIRQKMDYDYFNNYSEKRQLFQDAIIDSYFVGKEPILDDDLCILFTCGCFGSGKFHVINYCHNTGILNKNEFIYIDPDQIKYRLPEAREYINKDPLNAGTLLHKESTFLSLMIEYIALTQGYKIIIDGSLHNWEWYETHFQYIKDNHKEYTIGIIKVDCSLDKIKQRCIRRGEQTGRIISEEYIDRVYRKIPIAFNILKYSVHFTVEIDNNDQPIIKTTTRIGI